MFNRELGFSTNLFDTILEEVFNFNNIQYYDALLFPSKTYSYNIVVHGILNMFVLFYHLHANLFSTLTCTFKLSCPCPEILGGERIRKCPPRGGCPKHAAVIQFQLIFRGLLWCSLSWRNLCGGDLGSIWNATRTEQMLQECPHGILGYCTTGICSRGHAVPCAKTRSLSHAATYRLL